MLAVVLIVLVLSILSSSVDTFIGSGKNNFVTGCNGVIGGGQLNTIYAGSWNVIAGGASNAVCIDGGNTIGGGAANCAYSGNYSVIAGGYGNQTTVTYQSWIDTINTNNKENIPGSLFSGSPFTVNNVSYNGLTHDYDVYLFTYSTATQGPWTIRTTPV